MASSALAKKKPLHRKKKASAAKNITSTYSVVKKVKVNGCIDVADKSHIVIVDGNIAQQDVALVSLRKELAQLNEKAAIVINVPKGNKPEEGKRQFGLRWRFIP